MKLSERVAEQIEAKTEELNKAHTAYAAVVNERAQVEAQLRGIPDGLTAGWQAAYLAGTLKLDKIIDAFQRRADLAARFQALDKIVDSLHGTIDRMRADRESLTAERRGELAAESLQARRSQNTPDKWWDVAGGHPPAL